MAAIKHVMLSHPSARDHWAYEHPAHLPPEEHALQTGGSPFRLAERGRRKSKGRERLGWKVRAQTLRPKSNVSPLLLS